VLVRLNPDCPKDDGHNISSYPAMVLVFLFLIGSIVKPHTLVTNVKHECYKREHNEKNPEAINVTKVATIKL
jgi:hypothetical protein